MRYIYTKIGIIGLGLMSFNTFAQDTITNTLKNKQLEKVTIFSVKLSSIQGSAHYISTSKLHKLNQTNINTVLSTVPGVNIRDEEGFGLRPNIGLRGTSVNRSAKITLMEDGILIAPAPYADPSAYYFPTFARMKGIEVLKGSSQIKFGPYTIGGAVNLISTAFPNTFKGYAQLAYGSFNTNQQRVWVGDCKVNFDYVFEVNRLASSGFKQIDQGGNSGFDRRDIMGKLRWHCNSNVLGKQSIALKFVNSSEVGHETYLGLTFSDYNQNRLRRYAGTQLDILNLNHQHIKLDHTINPIEQLSIITTAYASNTYRDWARANGFGGKSIATILNNPIQQQTAYQIMTGQSNGEIEYQSAARTYTSKGIQINATYNFMSNKLKHKIQIGSRYHEDDANRYATKSTYQMLNGKMILTTAGINGNAENQIRSANGFASFFNYDLEYKALKLSPGIRYESININFENFGNADQSRLGTNLKQAENYISVVLPGMGVNYELKENLSIFGGIYKGFSPPGAPSVTSTSGQAKGESSLNYELGYRMEQKKFELHLTSFLNDYRNILGSDNVSGGGAGTGDLFNAGKAKILGIEFGFLYDILNGSNLSSIHQYKIPVSVTYTFTSAKFQETFVNGGGDWGSGIIVKGDFIPFITPHLLTVIFGLESPKFDASLLTKYTGSTRTKPGQSDLILPSISHSLSDINSIKSFIIVDLSVNYKLNSTFSSYILVNNLTNTKAIVSNLPQGYRPNMPLSLNVGLKINL